MSSTYAILAWGIDLGLVDSDRAKLFASYVEGQTQDQPQPTWDVYSYGTGANSWALCLSRSVTTIDEDGDKDVSNFLAYHFEGGDFSLLSQPNDGELNELSDLVKATPGASEDDKLFLIPILLPCAG